VTQQEFRSRYEFFITPSKQFAELQANLLNLAVVENDRVIAARIGGDWTLALEGDFKQANPGAGTASATLTEEDFINMAERLRWRELERKRQKFGRILRGEE
jgi:hypothetical protein